MRTHTTALGVCAASLLMYSTPAFAQKTVVTVDKGQVRAETSGGAVTVEAGQKAVLTPDKKPLAGVDDPLVDDLIALSKWVDAERQAKHIKIDYASIQIMAVEGDKLFRMATLFEAANKAKEPRTTDHIDNISGAIAPKFYDLSGKLLEFEVQKTGENTGYTIHYGQSVPPGALFRYILVSNANAPAQCLWPDGKLWHIWSCNDSPNCLNLFRFILPKSAILVQTSSQPAAADAASGRIAVTLRNYTGDGKGAEQAVFLWPEHDGATLADVPAEYRNGQAAWKAGIQDQYREQMAKIIAGQDYNDQSTPLAAMLTRNAALVRDDRQRELAILYAPSEAQRKEVDEELKQLEQTLGGLQGVRELIVDTVDTLSTQPWPKNPPEGYLHEIQTFGKHSPSHVFTTGFIFHGGKWYVAYNRPGPGIPSMDVWSKEHPKTSPAPAK
ncbi:MAG TPA: hypothetical protein VHP11_14575 [Tepidisphaeraceae bacterium]|nr:hypothetical protein [Tepidisphaeraceae bacterium]